MHQCHAATINFDFNSVFNLWDTHTLRYKKTIIVVTKTTTKTTRIALSRVHTSTKATDRANCFFKQKFRKTYLVLRVSLGPKI